MMQQPESINVSQLSDDDARTILDRVLEATRTAGVEAEKIRAQAERERRESEQLTDVKFGVDGLEATNLGSLWRLANMYARSDIVPEHYRAKPENCLIALQMAQRCKMDAFSFMQSSYIVYGRPGIEGKLGIAMLNVSGLIEGRIRFQFEGQGETRSCTAIVKDRASGEEIAVPLDWKTVEAEKWHLPKGKGDYKQPSKWTTIPDQMFRYRSAMFLIRAHYPEVLMGLRTVDEIEDELASDGGLPPNVNGQKGSRTEQLADRLGATPEQPAKADEQRPQPQPYSREPKAESPDSDLEFETLFDDIKNATADLLQPCIQQIDQGNFTQAHERMLRKAAEVRAEFLRDEARAATAKDDDF